MFRTLALAVFIVSATASGWGIRLLTAHSFEPAFADEGRFPPLDGAVGWLNSGPLDSASLRGKVVLIYFWTYSCINSLRPLPYVNNWAARYEDAGLVVVGVHTPEFSFEKERPNVQTAVRGLNITFPVAMDSDHRVWRAFENEYWPAFYLIDGKGRIRFHHFGEGDYDRTEQTIRTLLKDNGATNLDARRVSVLGTGIEAPPSTASAQSPETYVGYERAERFASPERLARNSQKAYSARARPSLNQWGLSGSWIVGAESAVLHTAPGKVVFRFYGRDLHMVLGPTKDGERVRFKVTLEGSAPGEDHGVDVAADGGGEIREPRLYQLIRQNGRVRERTLEIEFLDPGVQAFVFTFG
jgi:thiol-disulfide isomerase/thioredoxin